MADDRAGAASADRGRASAAADALTYDEVSRVLGETTRRWVFKAREFPAQWCSGVVPLPRPGWLRCGACGESRIVVRGWCFHTRPGLATVPRRCDVFVKCASCAAGWWHGVAIADCDWNARPVHGGWLRRRIAALSVREPTLWASDRRGRTVK